ncbi:MAG: uracil-DNA glycosylase [Armatimonadota bacterium]
MQQAKELIERLHEDIRSCNRCALPDNGPHRFAGSAGNRIMLIGQAPAKPYGADGKPFGKGNGHKRLFEWLGYAGFTEDIFRAEAYMTSVTKCYPGPSPSGKGDRKPNKDEITACSSYLYMELDIIRPELIILVGQLAISELLGDMKLSDAVGRKFIREFDRWSSIVIPLPHPSGANLWNNLPENQALVTKAMNIIKELKQDLALGTT